MTDMLGREVSTLPGGWSQPLRSDISPPSRHWMSRIVFPASLLVASLSLLSYSAYDHFIPATPVWVAPVVPVAFAATSGDADEARAVDQRAPELVVQAPGWIEPSPYAIGIPALAGGVVLEVLVLEGDRVESGQVVARLIPEDAHIALDQALASLNVLEAQVALAESQVKAAESKVSEILDQLQRARTLAELGGGGLGERDQLERRFAVETHLVEAARAAVAVAQAEVRRQEIACRQARLHVARMDIKAPDSGVVMSRYVAPGEWVEQRTPGHDAESKTGLVMRLYDPGKLQVRVDVPLAEFGKIFIGTQAQVTSEALPDQIFRGTLVRIVHEANIQRNTVPVMVLIEQPDPILKPHMLARVRFFGANESAQPANPASSGMRLLADKRGFEKDGEGHMWAWKVRTLAGGQAVATRVLIEADPGQHAQYLEVRSGLLPGDRIIIKPPPTLSDQARIRVLGEVEDPQSEAPR